MSSPLGLTGAFLVALGGAAGSVARYLASSSVSQMAQSATFPASNFPWGTWVVNTVGCFAIGCVAGLGVKHGEHLSGDLRLLIITGFLGGFTTFSAFGLESWTLWSRGEFFAAALNVLSQCVAGVALVAVGFWLTKG